MLANGDAIISFSIYGKFEAIPKPHTGSMVCKTSIFINNNLLSYKTWKQNSEIFNTAFILLLWAKVLLLPKNAASLQKNADISKTNGVLILTGVFSKTTYAHVLTYEFKFLA